MTLIVTVIKEDHIWQSSDNRISFSDGSMRDDESVKHVGIKCPDGTALLGWTGHAGLVDGTGMSEWVRAILRGETRTVLDSIELIRQKATQEIKNTRGVLFSIGTFINSLPSYYEITNFIEGKELSISDKFTIEEIKVEKPNFYSRGSGKYHISSADKLLLSKVLKNKPRKEIEYSDLLSVINERVSKKDKAVSASCVVVDMPIGGEPINGKIYLGKKTRCMITIIPIIVFGIDATWIMEGLVKRVAPGEAEELLKKSVIPRE